MRYYFLRNSVNKKVLGHDPQVKDVIYHCDVWEEPRFVDRFNFEKILIEPIIANPILHPKSELTDLISLLDIGFTLKLLASGKLKKILEEENHDSFQFFQCSVFQHGIEYNDYWLVYCFRPHTELINFSASEVFVRENKVEGGTIKKLCTVKSFEEFNELKQKHALEMEVVSLEKVVFKKTASLNFFGIRNGQIFVVSESLKQAIQNTECTGIEFQPTEQSLSEWMISGGKREKIYGKA